MKDLNPKIVCADGFTMSVQARKGAYCTPRCDYPAFPHTHVECGFPSSTPITAELRGYAERRYLSSKRCYKNKKCPFTETVYGYVPVETVMAELKEHGGIVEGNMPL